MNPVIYLDNNATTAVDPLVLEAMLPYLQTFYGNPSSMHSFGGQVGRALNQAREQVAALLGATRRRSSSPVAAPKATPRPFMQPWQPNPRSATSSPRR